MGWVVVDNILLTEQDPLVTATQLVADSGGALQVGDPRLEAAANGASAAVRRYCKWHVAPLRAENLVLDGKGGQRMALPSLHVVAVESVKLAGKELGASEFGWSEAGFLELYGHRFPHRYRSVEIGLTHGFLSAPDLVAIASQVARFALASPMGRTREQAGQIAVSWGTAQGMAWTESALSMMNPYRLGPLP